MSCGRDGSKPPAGSNQSKGPTKCAGFGGASSPAATLGSRVEADILPCPTPPCALAGSIILSTDGSVLMSADTPVAATKLLACGTSTNGQLVELKGHTDDVTTISFSSDGKWMATLASGRNDA